MEKASLQLTIDSILNQANTAFEGLLNGTMEMVSQMTESISSLF